MYILDLQNTNNNVKMMIKTYTENLWFLFNNIDKYWGISSGLFFLNDRNTGKYLILIST